MHPSLLQFSATIASFLSIPCKDCSAYYRVFSGYIFPIIPPRDSFGMDAQMLKSKEGSLTTYYSFVF